MKRTRPAQTGTNTPNHVAISQTRGGKIEMQAYRTKDEAIMEARHQSEIYNQGFTVPRNLVIRTKDGYAAHSVGNSLMLEFGREYELVGEIIGVGDRSEYIEFDPEELRELGLQPHQAKPSEAEET